MLRGGLCSRRNWQSVSRAAALCGHSNPQEAAGTVCGRQHGEVLRSGQQCVGVDAEAVARMASRKSRLDRSGPRRNQERTGGRGDAPRTLRRQCSPLRLAALTYNELTALKRLVLPAGMLKARPQGLRFLLFHTPWELAHHARRTLVRLWW